MALGIALMSFTETSRPDEPLRIAGGPAERQSQVLATGFSNVGSALSAPCRRAAGHVPSRAVNQRRRSRMRHRRGHAGRLMLLLAPLIAQCRTPPWRRCHHYSVGLFDPAEFRAIARVRRTGLSGPRVACRCLLEHAAEYSWPSSCACRPWPTRFPTRPCIGCPQTGHEPVPPGDHGPSRR